MRLGMSSPLFETLISIVPYRAALLRASARLPPRCRSWTTYRLLVAASRRIPAAGDTMVTNFGIASHLRCEAPTTQVMALFGKPTLYRGERASLELAARFSSRCDAFLDIGAHMGFFTLFVRSRTHRELPIHFFEPDPDLYALLNRNVRANKLDRVFGHEVAIGACEGRSRFFVN